MPKTYELCGRDVHDLIDMVMRDHHAPLNDTEVTVQGVFISDVDEHGQTLPALKRNGITCAAKIQITPLSDRARGMADAKLTIDSCAWNRLNERSRLALIDHELEHLQLKLGDDGEVQSDDLGRPKMKLKPHDYELAGFINVVERHGEAAVEAMELRRFNAEQLPLFPAGAVG